MTTSNLYIRDPASDPSFSYETSPDLYLFTSLTAGSSHIITATSRLETILKANRIPFKAVDCATDEKARRIWGRRAGKRKLPGLVRQGEVLADLEQTEEWNEYGEIKENLGNGQQAGVGSATKVQPPIQQHQQIAPQIAASAQTQPETTPQASNTSAASQMIPQSPSQSSADPLRAAQSTLASQAAALGAARSKPKAIPSSTSSVKFAHTTPEHIPTARSQAEGGHDHHSVHSTLDTAAIHRPMSSSPEADSTRDLDMSDPHPKHNTSQYTGLSTLGLPTRASHDEHAELKTPDLPNVPPPSAIEEVTSITDLPPPSASAASLTSTSTGEDTNTGESTTAPEDGAAPAAKSGLEAVTSDPEQMAAAMKVAGSTAPSGAQAGATSEATATPGDGAADPPTLTEPTRNGHTSVVAAPDEVVKAVERENTIPEEDAEDEAAGDIKGGAIHAEPQPPSAEEDVAGLSSVPEENPKGDVDGLGKKGEGEEAQQVKFMGDEDEDGGAGEASKVSEGTTVQT